MSESAATGDTESNARASQALSGYLSAAIEDRRGGPDDGGMLWQLANGSVEGEPVPPERALDMALLILMARHETTAHSAVGMLYFLAAAANRNCCPW